MPNTSAGLSIGWRFDSGIRYRGVLLTADYDFLRQGIFKWNQIKQIRRVITGALRAETSSILDTNLEYV